jgi:hypothetical protein
MEELQEQIAYLKAEGWIAACDRCGKLDGVPGREFVMGGLKACNGVHRFQCKKRVCNRHEPVNEGWCIGCDELRLAEWE